MSGICVTPLYSACGSDIKQKVSVDFLPITISAVLLQEGIPRYAPLIYRAALWLKRCHPDWGAVLIQMSVQDRYKDVAVPSERTLQRWFKAKQLYKPKSRFPLLQSPPPAHQVHDTWQIDAKEKLHLGSGQKASYLSVVDEYSGALLKAAVFPPLPHQ